MKAQCERLTMFMMPQTSEKPRATSARMPESISALTAIWPSSAPLIGEGPGDGRRETVEESGPPLRLPSHVSRLPTSYLLSHAGIGYRIGFSATSCGQTVYLLPSG